MDYTVALYHGEEEHYFKDVVYIQLDGEDYVIWGEGDTLLGAFPRKEVRYVRNTDN